MKVNYSQEYDSCTIEADGQINLSTVHPLEKTLEIVIKEKGILDVTIDLTLVDYIDSAGLGIIIDNYRTLLKKGGMLKLKSPNDTIRKVLSITRLDKTIPII